MIKTTYTHWTYTHIHIVYMQMHGDITKYKDILIILIISHIFKAFFLNKKKWLYDKLNYEFVQTIEETSFLIKDE